MTAQQGLEVIQFSEHLIERRLVGLLGGGEACTVHAVVHRRVDAFVECIDGRAKRLGVEVQPVACQLIEGAVENADDLCRLVVDDALLLFVPQHRYRHAAGVVWVILGIALVKVLQVVRWSPVEPC